MPALLLLFSLAALAQDWLPIRDWKATAFPNAGAVRWDKSSVILNPGSPMTGITAPDFKPKLNYEIRFSARRTAGNDFFCSLTFPYGESFATWVNGGWGGDIVGISSIDNWDASENETRTYFRFENGRDYRFRIEVREGSIRTFIDDRIVVDLAINGRTIGLRRGMGPTTPLSIFSYNSGAEIRDVTYRLLSSR